MIDTTSQFERDSRGLIKGVNYVYKSDGRIDWRAMISPQHLAINRKHEKEVETKYGKPLADLNVKDIDDRYLVILLAGIKELAQLRGYLSVKPEVKYVSEERCVVQTVIVWMSNFETNSVVEFGDVGSASLQNTMDFARNYLEAIAANRAFVRAVRSFLGIHIVGFDEIKAGDEAPTESVSSTSITATIKPHGLLQKTAEDLKFSFERVKEGAIKKKEKMQSEPEKWTKWEDIHELDCYTLVTLLKKAEKKG